MEVSKVTLHENYLLTEFTLTNLPTHTLRHSQTIQTVAYADNIVFWGRTTGVLKEAIRKLRKEQRKLDLINLQNANCMHV
jgi:hypothetical protein